MQGAIARHPFPGYFGNSAGTTAYFLAYGSGMLCVLVHALSFPGVPIFVSAFLSDLACRIAQADWTMPGHVVQLQYMPCGANWSHSC